MKYSIDGGLTYLDAPQDIRIVYEDLLAPGEDEPCDLHILVAKVGVFYDVWNSKENLGTSCELVGEIVDRLLGENS